MGSKAFFLRDAAHAQVLLHQKFDQLGVFAINAVLAAKATGLTHAQLGVVAPAPFGNVVKQRGDEEDPRLVPARSEFKCQTKLPMQIILVPGPARVIYCARPPFAMERLRKEGAALVYRCAKQHSEPGSDKRGAKVDEITLTPLELIDRLAALVPPPRTHRHRYFGVLAPNSPLRAAVTAFATPAQPATGQAESAITGEGVPPKRAPAHYLWAALIGRIYEVFPLLARCAVGRCV